MPLPRDARVWIERTIAQLALEGPGNRLVDFAGQAVFDDPLVGVADGDDPLFERFRSVVSPRHLLPREVLSRYCAADADLSHVSVIVWALPFTEEIRRSNRGPDWPSELYSVARNSGGALNDEIRRDLTKMLRDFGWAAVAPVLAKEYDAFRSAEHTFSSSWSERHVAYAAGLGQFGLNGSLITPLGSNVRFGSVVTNLPIKPTPRAFGTHQAPCLESHGQVCRLCIERCPVGAISENGLDKSKCYAMRRAVRERCLETYAKTFHMPLGEIVKNGKRESGYSLGCALCQCGVPCEGSSPRITLEPRTLSA
ncbi:MAG: epoxyqueuosine reductase [Planctomycetes bacterium]|nr:epoxyqueuosine reductase [Planctomycetota bacterium]